MYYWLTIGFSLLRMALGMDNSSFRSVSRGAALAANITAHRDALEQGSRRAEEMSVDGLSWNEWNDAEAGFELNQSHLVSLPGIQSTTCYGPMRLNFGDAQLTIFDHAMHLGERQRVLAPVLQTVGSYRVPNLNAPQFYSRPVAHNGLIYSEFLECFYSVDSMTAHSFNQIVESNTPSGVVDLLDTKTAFVELLPLLQERGLTVEWTGQNLLVYRLGEAISYSQIQEFAKEVAQVGELLRAANEEACQALAESLS